MDSLATCANISLTVNECGDMHIQNRCENTMTCMNEIIITYRVRLITDDSRLTVVTIWESHSGKSTTGKGDYWVTRQQSQKLKFISTSDLQLLRPGRGNFWSRRRSRVIKHLWSCFSQQFTLFSWGRNISAKGFIKIEPNLTFSSQSIF